MRPVRMVRGFWHLRRGDRLRFVAAWVALGLAELLIIALPFSVIRRLLGEHQSESVQQEPRPLTPQQRASARRIGAVVAAAAAHAPLRSDCYPQALTARMFLGLRRIPHVVCFGVRRDGDALVAHAWIRAGDLVVTGGNGQSYTEVGRFAWNPR